MSLDLNSPNLSGSSEGLTLEEASDLVKNKPRESLRGQSNGLTANYESPSPSPTTSPNFMDHDILEKEILAQQKATSGRWVVCPTHWGETQVIACGVNRDGMSKSCQYGDGGGPHSIVLPLKTLIKNNYVMNDAHAIASAHNGYLPALEIIKSILTLCENSDSISPQTLKTLIARKT